MVRLYKPEKYEVIPGNGENLALCTCWVNPHILVKGDAALKDSFVLIGSLYSKEGVSVLVRNLCLNPQIRHLLVMNGNRLSRTLFGSVGWKMLLSLWRDGVADDGTVIGDGGKLHAEIDPRVVRQLIRHVRLTEIDDSAVREEALRPRGTSSGVLTGIVDFPETVRHIDNAFPSEKVGWVVHGRGVVDAWLGVVRRIVRYGVVKPTEYGNRQQELLCVTWTMEGDDVRIPDWPQDVLSLVGLDQVSLREYEKQLLTPDVPTGVSYTYGQRLCNNAGIDQIERLIALLKANVVTRRAVATTLVISDLQHTSPPCLVQIQAITIGHKVNLLAVFRSHDIFKAAIPNAVALLGVFRHIVERTGLEMGTLAITSNSAHIYEEEWQHAHTLAEKEDNTQFDEHTDTDRRGSVLIRLHEGAITAELVAPDGGSLWEGTATTARELAARIARLQLLGRQDHLVDITIELVKAELALKKGLPYLQDVALIFDGMALR